MAFFLDFAAASGDDKAARVAFYLKGFEQSRPRRSNFESLWEESAAMAWTEYCGTFSWLSDRSPGDRRDQFQLDSAAAIASHRFGALCDSLATPGTKIWSKIGCSDPDLARVPAVRKWFADVTRILWNERYKPEANFTGQNQQNWQALGVFGNAGMRTMPLDMPHIPKARGLSYQSVSPGELYVIQDRQGRFCGYYRTFRWTAQQAYDEWPENLPLVLQTALQQQSKQLWNFIEVVHPRTDYTPWAYLTPKGKPYASCYISVEGQSIMEEGGYYSLPVAYARYMQAPDEDYGRGPAQMVLAAMKTKNAAKRDFLTATHKGADPVYLIGDDGLFDFKSHAGAYVTTQFVDGKPQIAMLPTGDPKYAFEAMAEEDKFIHDAFLVSLFKLLFDDLKNGTNKAPDTARGVIEYAAERGIFLAPTVGRQNTEYLGPMIDRELDILSSLHKLPPRPEELKEADGEYDIVFTSPLMLAAQAQEGAATLRLVETAAQVANQTGDNSVLDAIDLNEALQVIGEGDAVPDRVFASMEVRAQKAQSRAQAQQQKDYIASLPGLAAMEKAKAIQTKAATGGNIGGTLSGTPEGGMPMVPGNPRGRPGQPGMGGRPGMPGRPAR